MAGQTQPDVAATAYKMALDLWIGEFNSSPKATDGKFLELVEACALALVGRSINMSHSSRVKQIFAE